MAFPPRFIDDLTARNDIVDVVSSYVQLTKKGANYFGLCPFHNEKTPSFSVAPDKQIYHCFGCKKGGGAINFIMEIENLSYPDAVKFLADRAHMELPEETREQGYEKRQKLLNLNKDAARYFYDILMSPSGEPFRNYLEKRQISKATAQSFGLGASTDEWDGLIRSMTSKGYTKEELLEAGLIIKGKNGGFFDRFRNRLMFPLIDARGDFMGFTGRVLDDSLPKYMNSPETIVYSKRHTLYGIHLAKKTKRPNFILCEGNVDVISMHQAGFDNAVANMGTALTVEQTRLLSRYTKELILAYDNDDAGKEATRKALEILKNSEFTVKVLNLPKRLVDGKYIKQDPDDFIKYQGKDAFEARLTSSNTGLDFQMEQIESKYDLSVDEQRILYCNEVASLIATLQNPVQQEVYLNRAAQVAKISPETMKNEVQQKARKSHWQQKKSLEKEANRPAQNIQPRERSIRYDNVKSALAEEGVIRILLLEDSLFAEIPISPEHFSSPVLEKIYQHLLEQQVNGATPQINSLAEVLSKEEMSHLVDFTQKPESRQNCAASLSDYVSIIETEFKKRTALDVDPLIAARDRFKKK